MTIDFQGFSLNVVDLVIVGIITISGLLAFSRGAVREFFSIAGWVGAAAATYYGFSYVQPVAERFIEHQLLADVAAGVTLFVVTLIVVSFVSYEVCRRIKESRLNALDRSLGFLFGLARGAVIVCLAYIVLTWAMLPEEHPSWLREARAMPLVRQGVALLVLAIPPEARDNWSAARQAMESAASDAVDRKTAFEILMNPPPVADEATGDGGYSDSERQELDRLFENSQ